MLVLQQLRRSVHVNQHAGAVTSNLLLHPLHFQASLKTIFDKERQHVALTFDVTEHERLVVEDPLRLPLDSSAAALWTVSRDEIALDSARFKSQVLDSTPGLVPADVQCKKIKHCDKKGVYAIVCKHGSVQVEQWLQRALKLQRKLAYLKFLLCYVARHTQLCY